MQDCQYKWNWYYSQVWREWETKWRPIANLACAKSNAESALWMNYQSLYIVVLSKVPSLNPK